MTKKIRMNPRLFYIKSIFFFLPFSILQVNAETKIVAKQGDTLFKLSKQYGISLKELMHKNHFNDANKILAGEIIIIPKNKNETKGESLIYKVIEGDTLYKIAREYNVNVKDIISINNIDKVSILKPNQTILIPNAANYKKVFDQKNIKLARRKVSYHQTSKTEELGYIAKIHQVSIEEIISLNKLNNQTKIKPNTNLRIRESEPIRWLKYGNLLINWTDWRYLNGNYITQAKNKNSKSFYIAINCEKRALNHSIKNSFWTKWYFPNRDFEFKLINNFCDQKFEI